VIYENPPVVIAQQTQVPVLASPPSVPTDPVAL
jgi:hypothetical protein